MLTKQQIDEIRQFLENSQNPLFLFDNDVDGLCSFLLLQRSIGRGRGVPIRSFPDLDKTYLRRVDEMQPDAVFVLDKPKVSEEFIKGVHEKNMPLIWIDHHGTDTPQELIQQIHYYNSFPTAEPVTYICYQLANKNDDWLAMIGCIGDVYKPDFGDEFAKKNPEMFNSKITAFDSLFITEVGKVARMLNFGLKDSTTNVVKLMRYLQTCTNIHDILEENKFTKPLHYRYNQLRSNYERLMERAEKQVSNSKLILFSYSGETSMSSELANGLYFNHKDKFIVVAYKKVDKITISIRGKDAKRIIAKTIEGIDGATGGGHEEACGAQIPLDKFDEFRKKIEELLK